MPDNARTQMRGIPVLTRVGPMPDADLRPPRQERTQVAWERILDAGVAVLEEAGYPGFTIAAICARAEVTPPTIYARARNKQVLFFAVFEHGFAPVRRAQQVAFERVEAVTDSPQDAVRAVIAAIVRTTLAHADFLRPIVRRAEEDAEVAARTHEARAQIAERFRAVVLRHPDALRDTDPGRIDSCFRILFAALMTRVAQTNTLDIGARITDARLLADLQDAAERMLFRDDD